MIKVLHFKLSDNIGGIEIFLKNVYQVVDRTKIQFDFVTSEESPALEKEFIGMGSEIYKISSPKNIFQYASDIKRIIEKGYDYVHVHKNSAADIMPLIIASKLSDRPKIIVHSHNTAPSTGKISSFLHYINRNTLFKLSDYHFACSKLAAEWMYSSENIDKCKICSNGIITDKYIYDRAVALSKRQELEIPSDAVVIGNVGRFTRQKNHEFLLDIFSEFNKKNPDSYLLLVGEGELKSSMEEKAALLGIKEKVKFLGRRNDIPELMFAMDMFLLPSLYEGLPIVGVEARAAGLPLYMSDTVSKETELTDSVKWFSLNHSASEIADMLVDGTKKAISENDRKQKNKQIVEAGYDILKTAAFLENLYLNNGECNEK